MENFTVRQHILAVLLFVLCNIGVVQAQGGPSTGPSSGPFPADPGYVWNASNLTLTALNSSSVYLVNTNGNMTLTLPNVTTVAGREFNIYVLCNKIGSDGNITINATSGNVNGVASQEVTNTSGGTGNVSIIRCKAQDTTYGYTVGIIRK